MNYEAEYNKLCEVMKQKESEYCCRISEAQSDVINLKRENEILKAKLSVVEMIFNK